jgi:hypothetical protein
MTIIGLECDCDFVSANPLGRPDSEYHEGQLTPPNQPSALKLEQLSKATKNPNSKVEDTIESNFLRTNI